MSFHSGGIDKSSLILVQEAFKKIVDKFTPVDWKQACLSNLDKSPFPVQTEPAGY